MQALLAGCGRPLAAPSANASGRISPTRAEHVAASLGQRIPLILDSGPTRHGIESTIVGVECGRTRLLRPGPIDLATLGVPLDPAGPGIEAPGQMLSHYAPTKPLRLGATSARDGEWLIGFGPVAGHATLSAKGDLIEAAANLFDLLHDAERRPYPSIAIAPIVDRGLGAAINDRLRRAAAPVNDNDRLS
jgi:L-threonylcarbamoyladenylate synthase